METEEILAAIQRAADTIARPNWATWLSAIAALVAVVVAIIVAIKQNEIAKRQTEIAKEQTKISKKQAEISNEQNKIALLGKRIEIYNLALCCNGIAKDILASAKDNEEVCILILEGIEKLPFISAGLAINQEEIGFEGISIILNKLTQAEFLFSGEISAPLGTLAVRILSLMIAFEEEDFKTQKNLLDQLLKYIKQNEILKKAKDEVQFKSEVDVCPSPNPPTNPPSSNSSPPWATPTSTPPT